MYINYNHTVKIHLTEIKKKSPLLSEIDTGISSVTKSSTYKLSVVDSKNVQSLNKLTQKSEH